MAESTAGMARFVEQLVRRGVAPEADARRVAEELQTIAGAESMSERHVERLLSKYRQRFAGPHAIATVMRVADELCKWQARGGEAPQLPSRSWAPPPISPPPPAALTPIEPPPTLFDLELDFERPKSSGSPKVSAPPAVSALPEAMLELSSLPELSALPEPSALPDDPAPLELSLEEPLEISLDTSEAQALSQSPAAPPDPGLEEFDLELGSAAFDEASSGRSDAPPRSAAPSSAVTIVPRTAVPSAAPASGGAGLGQTLRPLTGPPDRRLGRAWAGIVGAAFAALVLVIALTRPSCLFHPRPADVSGRFRSEHLGITMTLSSPWAYTPADDTEKDSGEWQKRTTVMFRGESPLRFERLLLLTTWQKEDDGPVTEEDARTMGASETLGVAATQRECRQEGRGYKCRSIFHPANVLYNAFEYYFADGNRVVYVRALYELRGESETDAGPGSSVEPVRARTKGEIEVDAIVDSIEALGG